MELIAKILIGLIAVVHFYILWFEMFAWETRGRKVFTKFPPEFFKQTRVLAGNQGLYNGFLAAGLTWSLLMDDVIWQKNIALFFLACVAVAGLYGSLTADKKIFIVQGVPSILAIISLLVFGM